MVGDLVVSSAASLELFLVAGCKFVFANRAAGPPGDSIWQGLSMMWNSLFAASIDILKRARLM